MGHDERRPPPDFRRRGGGCAGGCLKGCAVLAVLVVLAFTGLSFWLVRAGGQRPTAGVVSEQSAGILHFAPGEDDPGVEALRERMRDRIEAEMARGQGLPGPLRRLASGIVDGFVPGEFTVSLEAPAEGGAAEPLTAVNPGGYVAVLRLLASIPERWGDHLAIPDYRGASLFQIDDSAYVAFLGGTVLFGPSEEGVFRGIDRLREGGLPGGPIGILSRATGVGSGEAVDAADAGSDPGPELRLPPPPPDGWDLVGWAADGRVLTGEIRESEEEVRPEHRELADALAEAGAGSFGADFEAGGGMSARFRIETASPEAAERLAEGLRRGLAEIGEADLRFTVTTSDSRVEGELGADDVVDLLTRMNRGDGATDGVEPELPPNSVPPPGR